MSHMTHVVALPGDIEPDKLQARLDEAMSRFDENLEMPLHRDISVYAETYAAQLAKAKASNRDNWTEGLTDDQIVEQWNGQATFDADGWPLTTSNPDGHWDYWRVGGRWAGAWVLKPDADNGPLQAGDNWDAPPAPEHDRIATDCARKNAIEAESITPTYSWLDLDGQWHTKWIGPTREEAIGNGPMGDTSHWERNDDELHAEFLTFLAALPADTWLIHIDYHS